ncbi:uncharacterized protein BO80DRAFT_505902 [Aspergillus ibericus CBS 121593]|uniref:DUF7029 domain-containing protein n=1 Tax=Aspergillus ibericus CBS 121593 TaxID=1448316 RepID=A0A395GKN1_9EURO|nr:hypothetical protein BO80DRAFT_505902 [Aspergillus ibericus CBS 121593]RAK95872.1 hypothetical protein BO80DRAFT_505902 [Aspergillus ibericus CBS 121593]
MRALSSLVLTAAMALPTVLGSVEPAHVLHPVRMRRDTGSDGVQPSYNISLYYQAGSQSSAAAHVDAQMKLPTVVLDNINSISTVDCSTDTVEITYDSAVDYETSISEWSSADLIILTNHEGNCDTENAHGVYVVSSLAYDNDTQTITAQAAESSLREQAAFLSVTFNSTAVASRKRDLTITLSDEWSGDLINTDDLAIDVQEVDLSTTVDLSGGVDFDVSNLTATTLYLELDIALVADVSVSAQAEASYSTNVLSYTFDALSVSAFEIAGILSIGPSLTFGVGVEFAITGEANVTADVSAQIADGRLYLDLLDSSTSSSSGWAPTYNASATLSAEVDAELNPFADVELSIGIDVLDGLLDVSAGIEARAEIVNEFSVEGSVALSTDNGVTVENGSGSCENGYWFTSDFTFGVDVFVTDLYSETLYNVTLPIYDTECIAF